MARAGCADLAAAASVASTRSLGWHKVRAAGECRTPPAHTHTHAHSHTHTHIPTYPHTHTHIHIPTYTYPHTQPNTHAHTCTHPTRDSKQQRNALGLFDTEPLPPPLPLPPPAPAAGATAADMSDTDPTEPLDFMDLLLDDEPWSDLRWHRSFSAGSVSSSPGTAATAFFACATTVAALSRAAACAARV